MGMLFKILPSQKGTVAEWLGPKGAASNSPGQVCEADAALGIRVNNASCPEWAASQTRLPEKTIADQRERLPKAALLGGAKRIKFHG